MEYEQGLRVEYQELITSNYKEKNTNGMLIKKEKERKRKKNEMYIILKN
jgi:hypothetical protein